MICSRMGHSLWLRVTENGGMAPSTVTIVLPALFLRAEALFLRAEALFFFISDTERIHESTACGMTAVKACHLQLPSGHVARGRVSKSISSPLSVFRVKALSRLLVSPLSNGTPKVTAPCPLPPIHLSVIPSLSGLRQE